MGRSNLLLLCLLLSLTAAQAPPPADEPVGPDRFAAWDLYIETDQPLAAYQIELLDETGQTKMTGIEGNASLPFGNPPYYDKKAAVADRVILADFSTAKADGLPTGRIRIATIHVMHGVKPPQWRLRLMAAATVGGREINAGISVSQSEDR
jgi:hypothetical protein